MYKSIPSMLIMINFDNYTDIDECDWNNGNCSQICNNIEGSYDCSCQAGYWLSDDEMTCYGKNKIICYASP